MVLEAEEVYFEQPPYRPPSESRSLLVRATRGCPWHRCGFCTMYSETKFEVRPVDDIKRDIQALKKVADTIQDFANRNGFADRLEETALHFGVLWMKDDGVKTAFIGDSNSIVMRTDDFTEVLMYLRTTFPTIERITCYARAHTLLRKTPAELMKLKNAGLSRLHVGLETGDDDLLAHINKGVTASQMVEAGKKVVESGISLCEYVILGLGGTERSQSHAAGTAAVLNAIDPDFIRVRTLMVIDGTPLAASLSRGEFSLLSPEGILLETRHLIEGLDVHSTFASDHVSNYLNLNGQLPDDKPYLLRRIDEVLASPPSERKKLLTPEQLRHP